MHTKCGGHYWFGQVFSWGWAKGEEPSWLHLAPAEWQAKTQKDETVNRGVKEAESSTGTDKHRCSACT